MLKITHNGETHSLNRWARILNVCAATLYSRYNQGLRGDDLFNRKSRRGHKFPNRKRIYLAAAASGRNPNLVVQKHKKEVDAWRNMMHHCYSTHCKAYPQYGGKGTGVCDAWRASFEQFLADVGKRPVGNYCLGRYDKSLDYTPENTAWMPRCDTHKGNGVVPVRLPYKGQFYTLRELSEMSGIGRCTIRARWIMGVREDELLSKVTLYKPKGTTIEHMGRTVTLRALSKEVGVDYGTLWNRYNKGDRDAELVRPSRIRNKPIKRR